jgi:amino acid transporter
VKKKISVLENFGIINVGIMGIAFISILLGNYNFNVNYKLTANSFGLYELVAVSIAVYVFSFAFLSWGIIKFRRDKNSLKGLGTEKDLRLGVSLNAVITIIVIAGFFLGSFMVPIEDNPILRIQPYFIPGLITLIIGLILLNSWYKVYKRVKNETV